MNPILAIVIIVIAFFIARYFICLAIDKHDLELRAIKRSLEDEERRKRMAEPWPPVGGAMA